MGKVKRKKDIKNLCIFERFETDFLRTLGVGLLIQRRKRINQIIKQKRLKNKVNY